MGCERAAISGDWLAGCEEGPPANELAATREAAPPVCGVVTLGRPLGLMPSSTVSWLAALAFHAAVASSLSHLTGSPIFSGAAAPSSRGTGCRPRMIAIFVFWMELMWPSLMIASWFVTSCSEVTSDAKAEVRMPCPKTSPSEICTLRRTTKKGGREGATNRASKGCAFALSVRTV